MCVCFDNFFSELQVNTMFVFFESTKECLKVSTVTSFLVILLIVQFNMLFVWKTKFSEFLHSSVDYCQFKLTCPYVAFVCWRRRLSRAVLWNDVNFVNLLTKNKKIKNCCRRHDKFSSIIFTPIFINTIVFSCYEMVSFRQSHFFPQTRWTLNIYI